MAFNDALDNARKAKRFTAEYMAEQLGYKSKVSYYNIVNGEVDVTLKQAQKLSTILRKPIKTLFPNFFKTKVQENGTCNPKSKSA